MKVVYQDFTDAAMIALDFYMEKLIPIINEKLPENIGPIEVGMGGEWSAPLTGGRVLYATPFWEMGEGIPVCVDNDDGEEILQKQVPFEITGDLEKDAALYVSNVALTLAISEREKISE